jgi:two-component system KDP operon response regulator KdpE
MSNAKILVVDDEPQIRRLLRATLTGHGYQVADARSGEEALEKFREYLPDLVIMDLNMPGMGGLEASREIRMDSDVPIIILTVRNAESEKVEAQDAGADDFVCKPFGMQELLARIRAALRRAPTSPEGGQSRARRRSAVQTAFGGANRVGKSVYPSSTPMSGC